MAITVSKPVLIALIIGMVVTSVVNTISTKVLFTLSSTGADGQREPFSKPWFGAWNMLTAMMLVGILDKLWRSRKPIALPAPDMDEPLIEENSGTSAPYWKKVVCVAIPAFFDLTATGVMIIGLILIPASICNMLRGSCIVFSAIFSVMFLKGSKIHSFQWFALVLCCTGIALVGIAEWCAGAGSGSGVSVGDSLFGMLMVVIAQVIQALQLVAEEFFMKECDLPMLEIVGWEGFWGVVMMIFGFYPVLYVLPGKDHGHMEDAIDTFYQIKNSSSVAGCAIIYVISCATFNATGIAITGALSAVHRIILVAVATLLIWMTGLFVHYYVDPTAQFGEVWNPTYSWLQLGGFMVLILGQLVYGKLLKVPGFSYPREDKMLPAKSPGAALNVIMTPSRNQVD